MTDKYQDLKKDKDHIYVQDADKRMPTSTIAPQKGQRTSGRTDNTPNRIHTGRD